MSKLITLCLVIVGLINVGPVLGMLSAANLEKAYAISVASKDLEILLRHRALLFGVLGGFVLYAAFSPAYQVPAMVMVGVSMVGFCVLALNVGGHNEAISKVFMADVVGMVVLLIAAGLKVFAPG